MVRTQEEGKGDSFQKSQKEILKLFPIWSGLLLATWQPNLLTANSAYYCSNSLAGEEKSGRSKASISSNHGWFLCDSLRKKKFNYWIWEKKLHCDENQWQLGIWSKIAQDRTIVGKDYLQAYPSRKEEGWAWGRRRLDRFSHHLLSGALCVVSKTFAAA